MRRNSSWLRTWLRIGAFVSGTLIASPLAGCKPSVTQAFYSGLENLIITLVQTYFEAITPTPTDSTAALMYAIRNWLA